MRIVSDRRGVRICTEKTDAYLRAATFRTLEMVKEHPNIMGSFSG